MRTFDNAYDAYWFLYNHPNCVEIDPEHPVYDTSDEFEPFDPEKSLVKQLNRKPKNPEAYRKAVDEHRTDWYWEGQFINNLDIHYTKVNPETNHVEDDRSLNTKIEVWLETGPAYWDEYSNSYQGNMHDIRLDVGGDTFEEALINLANKVLEHYGDYEDTE